MAAMASGGEEPNRRSASIANLLLPSADLPEKNSLLSLSHLAASMQPVTPTDPAARRRRAAEAFARNRPVPPALARAARPEAADLLPDASTPDDRRRAHRLSRSASVAGPPSLGVSHAPAKRLSRTKSAFAGKAALRAAAAAASGRDSNIHHPVDSESEPAAPPPGLLSPPPPGMLTPPPPALGTPQRQPPPPLHAGSLPSSASLGISPAPSPTVLRPLSSNPIGGYASKHTSASDSIESCVPADGGKHFRTSSPSFQAVGNTKRELFHSAAQRFSSVDFASNALTRMRNQGRPLQNNEATMDIDDQFEQREPSSSSHDAKLMSRPSRTRTTPDAKRAQNRESAKRFRVAQKKRWADLLETVDRKDEEIVKLKNMLQEVTNKNLATRPTTTDQNLASLVNQKADALSLAELGLFVKLMCSKTDDGDASRSAKPDKETFVRPPIAANIGSLYRVIVAKLDGSVLGIRHQNESCGSIAMGGEVGGCVWEHVHQSDFSHLRFTVVHAANLASVLQGEPTVLSYRRRELVRQKQEDDVEKEKYMRMKGCLYPLADENGAVTSVILAEFMEI